MVIGIRGKTNAKTDVCINYINDAKFDSPALFLDANKSALPDLDRQPIQLILIFSRFCVCFSDHEDAFNIPVSAGGNIICCQRQ